MIVARVVTESHVGAELLDLGQLRERLSGAAAAEQLSPMFGCDCIVLDLRSARMDEWSTVALPFGGPNCAVLARVHADVAEHQLDGLPDWLDVACGSDADLDATVAAVLASPVAALALVQLLRHNERASVTDGLFAESLAYSTLQSGAVFAGWLARRRATDRRPASVADGLPLVLMACDRERWLLTLNRPHARNAYSAGLRDALVEALQCTAEAREPFSIVVRGAGPSFSAGGDLNEFGEARDAAVAHAIRSTRSAAQLMHRLRERITCEVHGACIGAGIELPAFAHRVVAAPDSFFRLPEVAMGLIPGAGGTVSMLRRIGRLRLAEMALTGMRVDAPTALAWGLIDAIS